jgi:hypothetical protein
VLRTIAELDKKLRDLEAFYNQRNTNMLAWRDLYFMKPESIWTDEKGAFIKPEADEERIVLPIAYNTVEGFRELLFTKAPAISVPQSTVSGVDALTADHNEKALLTLWDRARIYERLRDSLWHGLVDGWGVLQEVWEPRGEGESPITILHHDPFNVFAMPGDRSDEWKYVIHKFPRLVAQVKEDWYPKPDADRRTRKVKDAEAAFEGLKDTDEVTFVDYWDEEVNAVAIACQVKSVRGKGVTLETRWIKAPTRHNYGFLPWEIYMPCRLPFRTLGERMGVSILYVMQGLIEYKDRELSMKATMLKRYQDPPLVTRSEQGVDLEPIRTESGMHLRMGVDEQANYLMHPGPMPQIDTMLAQIDEYIEASGLPKVLQGAYVGQVSGVAMSLLRNPTLMKVAFRQKEIERAAEQLNSHMLMLIEKKAKKPLYLWGKNSQGAPMDALIDPDKIGGYYRNEVKLSASLPTDDANTVNMLASLVQLRIISRATARDVAQQTLHDMVPQSLTDEETKVLAEMIWNDEGMIMALAKEAANEVSIPYYPKAKNPMGGRGEKEITMPSTTLAAQSPGMPGGNTQPDMAQRLAEMAQAANPTGAAPPPTPETAGLYNA